ncbi:nuclease-related domain-containing protein [Chromohalobacter sp. HP20-39]|uniref:nuclease-related domain-containing protein n=1 Tax=Chromohalobacter sp. HP20-39 TaxID=3079306 RepID=UPI00294AF7D7|nr:nuclease-related domain-containing protein [Chromohalobacter sp. HP20-39]MDV6318182.1 nuclease-related domain-containing protein [Chromohalobacter sp. HP20-39]
MVWLEYVLPIIFLAPLGATALVVLALRHLEDGALTSPYDGHTLREPAQSLRDRLDRAYAALFLDGALGPIITLAPLVYGMGRMLFANQHSWLEWALYGLLTTLLALVLCFRLIRDVQRIRRLKLGLACELAVGQELERLIRPEAHPYFVFHDVPTDSVAIDHVVVTPHGVFVVEVSARTPPLDITGETRTQVVVAGQRLRFPGWRERQSLAHTRMATSWCRQWLTRHSLGNVAVQGVLVLPGWDVEIDEPPSEIMVVDGQGLAELLNHTSLQPMDDATHQRVVQALDQRVKGSLQP